MRFLLSSLVVVIVGGMGSIPGAALGAVLIGCAEQFGSVYAPTYSVVLTFIIMVAVLAFRPQGLLGRIKVWLKLRKNEEQWKVPLNHGLTD